ncbi:uncharacterized protein [Patagioenas fasciata]|uniref:uncharacterized protein n=1 Tax=Patagioenas fasciata TaxID=372321 RepID=UPI003A99D11E
MGHQLTRCQEGWLLTFFQQLKRQYAAHPEPRSHLPAAAVPRISQRRAPRRPAKHTQPRPSGRLPSAAFPRRPLHVRSAGTGAGSPRAAAGRYSLAVGRRPLLAGRCVEAAGGVRRGRRCCPPGCCAVSGASPPPCQPAPLPAGSGGGAAAGRERSGAVLAAPECVLIWRKKINHTEASPSLQVHFLQIICKFSIMAIHSFCHLEEPVPQNNDLKKAHLFARKSLHLGNSTGAAKMCFVRFRSLTFSGMRISEQTDYWGLPSYSSGTVSFIAVCSGLTSYWTTESGHICCICSHLPALLI